MLLIEEKENKLKCRKELKSNIRDPGKCEEIHSKKKKKKWRVGDISEEQWLEHFKTVFLREQCWTRYTTTALHNWTVHFTFANDIVLLPDTIVGLQNQWYVLGENATKLDHLQASLDKTNIAIFRNVGKSPGKKYGTIIGKYCHCQFSQIVRHFSCS